MGDRGAGEGTDGESAVAACLDPEVLIQPGSSGRPSGFEACADGFIHRTQAVQCDPSGFGVGDCINPWESPGECTSDDECVAEDGSAGVCLDSGEPSSGCSCSFGCSSDADCEDGQSCYCDGSRSACITASCRTDADCDEGELCGLNQRVGGCGTVTRTLSCTTPADECRVDADCDECLQCLPGLSDPARTCSASTGVCGPCG
ncbi:MAG: hypothetical protein AAF721_00100 [Myxococcota bacterium]